MAREGIYIGNNEVVARYVGTTLVWELALVEAAHFENLNGWVSYGEIILKRSFYVNKTPGETKQPDYDYNVSKAKVNGKMYDIEGCQIFIQDLYSRWNYNFIITFKNKSDRDEVSRMSQKDIYLYKRG